MGSFGVGVVVGGVCFLVVLCSLAFLCCWPIILIELSNHDYFSTAS